MTDPTNYEQRNPGCCSCRFWRAEPATTIVADTGVGLCHRYPPVLVDMRWGYPGTNGSSWCGEWQPNAIALHQQPIASLGLWSVRVLNALDAMDLVTVGDLLRMSQSELLMTPNFGFRSLAEVVDRLASVGLKLRESSTDPDDEGLAP